METLDRFAETYLAQWERAATVRGRKRYVLVPLQVHNDSQILRHSRFGSVANFIDEVLASFAVHSPAEQLLVFKHHPLDRPYNDYRRHIARRAAALGVAHRVHYIHDQHLPTLLMHAAGVVTVNSTTGLQSMYHGTPVITLRRSPGLIRGLIHRTSFAFGVTAVSTSNRSNG